MVLIEGKKVNLDEVGLHQVGKMLFSKEIEDLHNDGFDGSVDERNIFTEVFFGNDNGRTSNRCLVTGVINFECEQSENTDSPLCSNGENSVQTSQADSCYIKEHSRRNHGQGRSAERFTSSKSNDHDVNVKRVKLSVVELSNVKSHFAEVKKSPVPTEGIDCRMSQPAKHLAYNTVTGRLVESSKQGITSSCYLLKRRAKMDRGGDTGDKDVLKCGISSLDGVDGKEVGACRAIASPISQESSATKLLVASQCVTIADQSISLQCAKKRWGKSNLLEVDIGKMLLKSDLVKDPLSLLRNHVNHLLVAAGWGIGRRRREHTTNGEYVYTSPLGQPIRELRRVWELCGQILFADLDDFVQESEGKEWTDITQFLSDLSNTLVEIEEELSHSGNTFPLVHRWCLLDPFANIVFVEKTVKALKVGNVVRAKRSFSIDTYTKNDDVLALTNWTHGLCDSSLIMESELTDSERKCFISKKQRGKRSTTTGLELLQGGAVKSPRGVSTYLSEENYVSSVDAVNGTYSPISETLSKKKRCMDLSLLRAYCSDSDQSESSLYEVPVTSGNEIIMLGGSKTSFSCDQDSDTGSPSCNRHSVDYDEVMPLRIMKDASMGSSELEYRTSPGDFVLTKKAGKKAKKIIETKPTTLHRNDRLGLSTSYNSDLQDLDDDNDHLKSREFQNESCKQLVLYSSQHRTEKKQSKFKEKCLKSGTSKKLVQVTDNKHPVDSCFDNNTYRTGLHVQNESMGTQIWRQGNKSKKTETQDGSGKKRPSTCQLKDDDLLISAIIKNKSFKSGTNRSTRKKSSSKSKALKKRKSQKGSCRLLPRSLGKGGKNFVDGRWTVFGVRTVLSWLINSGVVSLNEVIQYRSPKDDVVVKDGLVTPDGILCKCCNKVLSLLEFKIHAGFRLNRPCLNLFMESGKPFTLCQLEAWSAEYKARKSAIRTVHTEEVDQNDDSCGLCGDGGELICCDNCPSTFHRACLCAQELPEGNWYCTNCTCRICGDVVLAKEASKSSPGAFKCSQCEHKYHESCLQGDGVNGGVDSDPWFCGQSCQEVYSVLRSRIGLINLLSDGLSWTLLRCIQGDQRVHSAQRSVALKAECNSKLAVALTIMEECFLPMVDPRTGIDMIPHVLYNWGSTFARLDYHGFYTMVLEKDDELLCVAVIRIHGVTVAEMPLIATCSKYRRQGMCRRLMNCILEMLRSFKVEKLVITAIPDLVETWTVGFGFEPLEGDEKQSLSNINLMVFPGTVWLKKSLFENQVTDQQTGSGHASHLETEEPAGIGACSQEEPISESAQQSDRHSGVEIEAETQTRVTDSKNLQGGEQDGNLDEHSSKLDLSEKSHFKTQFDSGVEIVAKTQTRVADSKNLQEGGEEDGNLDEHSPKTDLLERSLFETQYGEHENLQEGEGQYGNLSVHISKLSFETNLLEKIQLEVGGFVKSVDVNDEREFSSNNQLQNVQLIE